MRNQDVYAQAEWFPLDAVSLLAGARYSDVRFDSIDHYITALNPDDSGRVAFSHASPVGGIVWRAADDVNVYANWGEGFETPTFIELAYRNTGTGLNFALRPAISRSTEIGVKAYFAEAQRVNFAAFVTHTSNEIIIDAATGGRTTYKNAGKTRRRGVEAQWEGASGRRSDRLCGLHLPVGEIRRGYDHRDATAARAVGVAPACRAGNECVCRAGLGARRMGGILGRAGSAVRGQALRQ